MNKLKKMSIALVALFLMACSNDASSDYYAETTEATETTAQQDDNTGEGEDSTATDEEGAESSESEAEASDDPDSAGESANGQEGSSAGQSTSGPAGAGTTVSIKSTDTAALEASPQGEVIQLIVSRDPDLDPKAENYSYLLIEEDDGVYQLEVRLDNADGSVANLVALYRYDEDEDRVEKQNPVTGEFEELAERTN